MRTEPQIAMGSEAGVTQPPEAVCHPEERMLPAALATGLARPHLPGLDGLRAVAAFLVVFYHLGLPAISGGLGVLIFFVLSGFLITWLLLEESEKSGTISLRAFYVRRALRIFPAFYCYVALLLAVAVLIRRPLPGRQLIASLLYVNNYYQALRGDPGTGLSHTWSLAIEEQFYLLWPISFLVLRRRRVRLALFLCGLIACTWIYRAWLMFGLHVDQGYLYEAFDARADHLMVGCLLAVALRARLLPRVWDRICARASVSLVTAGLLAASDVAEYVYGPPYRDSIGAMVNPLLVAVLIAQIIAFRAAPWWRWLGSAPARYLGRISYSVYLYQQLVMHPAARVAGTFGPTAAGLASIASAILFASLSYYLVERPFLSLKHRFQRPREHSQRAASDADAVRELLPA